MYVVQTNLNVILVFASVKEDVQGHASHLNGSKIILMIQIARMDQMKAYANQTNSSVSQVNVNEKEDAQALVSPLNGSMIILTILIVPMDQMSKCPHPLLSLHQKVRQKVFHDSSR